MQWKRYQIETAEFFRTLGCIADEDATVEGARGLHKVDVWVRFNRFGVETKWVIECKHWRRSVPKEKVMVLKSVVEDIGADRGILISIAGFQSGAILAAQNTNITLTSLVELKETTRADLISSLLHTLEDRATALKYSLHNLYVTDMSLKVQDQIHSCRALFREWTEMLSVAQVVNSHCLSLDLTV